MTHDIESLTDNSPTPNAGALMPADTTLTAEQVKALRNAEDIWFKHSIDMPAGEQTFIGARKRFDPGDGFGTRDLTTFIPAEPMFTLYNRSDTSTIREAFTSGCGKFSPEWQTAVSTIKTGDKLVLHWTTNNSNAAVQAGLTVIEFRLEVRRPDKNAREKRPVFLLNVDVELRSKPFYIKWTTD